MRMTNASEFFSANYVDARARFLDASARAGARVETITIPEKGPGGEALSTDVARFGADDAQKYLLVISGTHGAEGLCGSGVQVGLLEEARKGVVPEDVALLLVHAINPYGYAWLRRATEEGIDLCRNFMDFAQSLPENPLYDELATAIVPEEWTGPAREAADRKIKDTVERMGLPAFVAQIPLGQYRYDFAPFYGGQKPAQANLNFRHIIDSYLADATDVAAVDYHTGLGPYGHGELLCFHRPDSAALRRAKDWWGDALVSVFSEASVAYPLTGGILEGLEHALPNARVTAAAYEFGTVEPMKVLDAMRADHWLHTHGDLNSPLAREIKQNMVDTFYGDTDDWRESIWRQAKAAHTSAMEHMSDL